MNQRQRLLDYLQTYGSIDPMTAWQELGIYRLSAVIFDLKKEGAVITTERKKVVNRWGETCIVGLYVYERDIVIPVQTPLKDGVLFPEFLAQEDFFRV